MSQSLPIPEDFPVQWEDPSDVHKFWTRDRMHSPNPISVLEFDLGDYVDRGFRKAFDHFGLPFKGGSRLINTYRFSWSMPALEPEEMAARGEAMEQTMRGAVAELGRLWNDSYLPEIQSQLAFWSDFDLAGASMRALMDHLEESLARYERVWELHFLIVIPMRLPVTLFEELYRELFGSEKRFAAYELLEGLPNKTVESGTALWRISRRALASDDIRKALAHSDTATALAALSESVDGRTFLSELTAYLEEFGQRGNQMSLTATSWIEDPTPVLNNVRGYMAQPERDLIQEMDDVAARREGAIDGARTQLQGYPEPVVQQFEFLLSKAQEGTMLSEDHGFWIDFRCTHQMRMVLMELGRRLASAGTIDVADDVFHLMLDELRRAGHATTPQDHRSLVSRRKAEIVRWSSVSAPDALGTPSPGGPTDNPMGRAMGQFFGAPVEPSHDPNVVKGHAGSPGVVSGRARIIRSIDEAGVLQPGDILVAETTAPPWTPLFATVAAVVTDIGGILSHCAVVAREYGIPAVVGTKIASTVITEGQLVEVDGTAGLVRILDERSAA